MYCIWKYWCCQPWLGGEVLIFCCGSKQLVRKGAGCLLTGRDSRGSGDSWEHGSFLSSPPLSVVPLLHFHPLISFQRPTSKMWGNNYVLHIIFPFFSSFCFFTWSEPEPAFNSPRCSLDIPFSPLSHLFFFFFSSVLGYLPFTQFCSINQ